MRLFFISSLVLMMVSNVGCTRDLEGQWLSGNGSNSIRFEKRGKTTFVRMGKDEFPLEQTKDGWKVSLGVMELKFFLDGKVLTFNGAGNTESFHEYDPKKIKAPKDITLPERDEAMEKSLAKVKKKSSDTCWIFDAEGKQSGFMGMEKNPVNEGGREACTKSIEKALSGASGITLESKAALKEWKPEELTATYAATGHLAFPAFQVEIKRNGKKCLKQKRSLMSGTACVAFEKEIFLVEVPPFKADFEMQFLKHLLPEFLDEKNKSKALSLLLVNYPDEAIQKHLEAALKAKKPVR